MGEKRQSSKFLKRCLEDQLYIMMKKIPYRDIDIKMLCEAACVGRSSFYRYFKSLDDVILFSFIRAWDDWCEKHDVKIRDKFTLDNAVTFFEYNYSIKDRLSLIYQNNLEYILLQSFEMLMSDDNDHNYESRFYAYGLFALLKEWYTRNFVESPNDLSKILCEMFKDIYKLK